MAEQKSKTKDNASHSGAKEKNKKEQIKKIPQSPEIDNRGRIIRIMQKDIETGKSEHLVGSNLELRKEFDIKRLKKIKSYKGYRHSAGLPVRGQRTRAHFRKNRSRGAGIKKK